METCTNKGYFLWYVENVYIENVIEGKRLVMVKIIMDSGKEYECTGSAKDIQGVCYRTEKMPSPTGRGIEVIKFDAKFLKITDNVIIRTDHISSIEE